MTPAWLKPFEWADVYFVRPVKKFLLAEGAGIFLVPALAIIFIQNTWHEKTIKDIELVCSKVQALQENPLIPRDRPLMLMDCVNAGGDEKTCLQKTPENLDAENLNSALYGIQKICSGK